MTDRLDVFLRTWLGQWPPTGPLTVVEESERDEPSWDGAVRDVVGVATPDGAVVSVPPGRGDAVRASASAWSGLATAVPRAVGRPDAFAFVGVFRWCTTPAALPDAGVWVPSDDGRLPDWLRPFRGDVLVAFDGDTYAAGVGLKRHNEYGLEIAVGTDESYRGRGLAAQLSAQAARRILAEGAVPIYLHDPANVASARTADRAGYPDVGWQVLGITARGMARLA